MNLLKKITDDYIERKIDKNTTIFQLEKLTKECKYAKMRNRAKKAIEILRMVE